MERIRPVNAPDDDSDPKSPERFSPYAVPLSTLVAGVYVSQADQHVVVPDPVSPMRVPVGPEDGD